MLIRNYRLRRELRFILFLMTINVLTHTHTHTHISLRESLVHSLYVRCGVSYSGFSIWVSLPQPGWNLSDSYSLRLAAKVFLICIIPHTGYDILNVSSVMGHCVEQEIKNVARNIRRPIVP